MTRNSFAGYLILSCLMSLLPLSVYAQDTLSSNVRRSYTTIGFQASYVSGIGISDITKKIDIASVSQADLSLQKMLATILLGSNMKLISQKTSRTGYLLDLVLASAAES